MSVLTDRMYNLTESAHSFQIGGRVVDPEGGPLLWHRQEHRAKNKTDTIMSSTPQKSRSRFITVFFTCKDAFLKFERHIFYIG
jgi:hypothetical protein